jgi:hypothetical protein
MKATTIPSKHYKSILSSMVASQSWPFWRFPVQVLGMLLCPLLLGAPQASAQPTPATYSIWDNSFLPDSPSVTDGLPITLGVKFQSAVDGYITGIRFYKGDNSTEPHEGKLWTGGGLLKASVTFSNETANGWQQQLFDTPVAISSNTTYIASYHSSSGYFAITPGYFSTGGHTNAPLVALADGVDGGNGVFLEPSNPDSFPTASLNAANYWVDVVLSVPPADTTPPTISCPSDVTLQCASCNTDTNNTGVATATDDSGSVTVIYSDVVSGVCPKVVTRTWTATDPTGNVASCVQTITCVPLPSSLVTDCSGCVFDSDPTTPVQDFDLLFMPDPHKRPFYRLNDSNPGGFFYNVFYTGSPGQRVTFNITLPYPFVTQGFVPIRAYDSVTVMDGNGQQCLVPGNAFFVSLQQVRLADYGRVPAPFTLIPVTLKVPASGVVYLAISLDYGLTKASGYMNNFHDDAVDYAHPTRVLIPNHGSYTFSVSGAQTGTTSIQNDNSFKQIPGVAGLVQHKGTLAPVPQAVVTLSNAKHAPIGSAVTDEDGFYMIAYKYTGKAATFYLSVTTPPPAPYKATQTTTLKANAFVEVDFLVP